MPCDADSEWGSTHETCTNGRIALVSRFDVHDMITGMPKTICDCDRYVAPSGLHCCRISDEVPSRLTFPSHLLATITGAREHGDEDVNQVRVFTDGAYLWIVRLIEYTQQFRGGVVVVADRRLLSNEDQDDLCEVLGLDAGVDLNDDAALKRALEALPQLGPGETGRLW